MKEFPLVKNYLLYANKTYSIDLHDGISVSITPTENTIVTITPGTTNLMFSKLPEYGQ